LPDLKRRYWERLHQLLGWLLNGSNGQRFLAIASTNTMPTVAEIAWPRNEGYSEWPNDAPWSPDSVFADAAMITGGPLAEACDRVMLMELGHRNLQPVCEWLEAGWTPGTPVLWELARLMRSGEISIKGAVGAPEHLKNEVRDIQLAAAVKQLLDSRRETKYKEAVKAVADRFGMKENIVQTAYNERFSKAVTRRRELMYVAELVKTMMNNHSKSYDEAIEYVAASSGKSPTDIELMFKEYFGGELTRKMVNKTSSGG